MSKNWTRDEDYGFRSPLDEVIRGQNELMRSSGNPNPQRQNNQRFDDRNRQQQNNPNNGNRDFRNNNNGNSNNYDNNRNNNNQQTNQNERNPFLRLIGNDGRVYSNKKDEIYKLLIDDKGFDILIRDLKAEKKNPGMVNVKYVQTLLRDPIFASQFIEAMHDIIGKENENGRYSKKQIQLLMTEIYSFVNASFNKDMVNRYDPDTLETMRDAYRDILYEFNKKKVKKLTEKVGDLDKRIAKEIVILASGFNATSVYHLIKFLYKNANTEDAFEPEPKSLKKIFMIAYGCDDLKDSNDEAKFKDVIKWIMLERALPVENNLTDEAKNIYANITKMMCKYLNKCDKNDADDIILGFVKDRRKQEDNKPCMPRRFNPKSVHPDDYPNIIEAVSRIEKRDFSTIPYLGRVNKDNFNKDKDEVTD